MAELIPAPFSALTRRLFRELEREDKAFDLPRRRFWRGSEDLDLGVRFHGRPAGNPVGPAAGPQDQMAQNIVLAWLAGSRILELKTVQINDRLTIPRPCIDATNVGFNVEWSQELRLEESLREYVAGSMLVDMLRSDDALGRGSASPKDDTIFDMSVGYDLAGIRSPQVRGWIEAMQDAREHVAALRAEIPPELARFRDLDFATGISDQITLSTFHGCPAHEIEGIARFLIEEMDVHVTVKLNPTLLGRPRVNELLHDLLGYHEIETRQEDFDKDLQWDQALELTDRMTELARARGRTFQVKFSNTLVVTNHRDFFPKAEAVQYLSGQPLHVVTMHLVERFRKVRPEVPISFSAGVDGRNFADAAACGFTPITTCTDLLRPGGYARLPPYLDRLEDRMRERGVGTIGDFVIVSEGHGTQAVRDVVPEGPRRTALLAALESATPRLQAACSDANEYAALVARAGVLNTPDVVARVAADERYRADANRGTPRKIGSTLALFDCINCDKCVPVCPNDANFVYETPPVRIEYRNYRLRAGVPVAEPGGVFEVKKAHQLANFQDFCNECGNCDTFCPEDGGPYIEKPRFFGSEEAWRTLAPLDGFYVARGVAGDLVLGRIRASEYRLELDRATDRARFGDGAIRLELRHSERTPLEAAAEPGATEGHLLDLAAYLNMAVVADGVLDPRLANPVNAHVAGVGTTL